MLASLLRERPSNELSLDTTTWGVWPGDEPGPKHINRDTALQLMAVYGSVRLISEGISTLPVDVFDADGTGQRVEVDPPRWLHNPTPELSYEAWCSQVLTSLLLDGNAFLAVVRDRVGRVAQVRPLDPAVMQVERDPVTGRILYRMGGQLVDSEILHVPAMMLPGSISGMSPIEYARRTVGLGINAVDFGSEFFDNEGNMPGVIEAPHDMQPDTQRNLAEQWRKKRRKGGRGLPGVLKGGATWKSTGVNNEQAQFLATRKFTAAEIAGQMFLVDPSDLGIPVEGTSLTYANLQERSTRRVQVTFLPWIIRIERTLSGLMSAPSRYVKLNVNGYLRADPKARYETYQIGINTGVLDPGEAREFEDLPPRPDTPVNASEGTDE